MVTSSVALAAREKDSGLGSEQRLRAVLAGTLHLWDVVLIDCPPALGSLTVNALVAADVAMLVTEPRATSVDGLGEMATTVASVRSFYNDRLRLAGIVVNKYRRDRPDRVAWVQTLHRDYPGLVLQPYLPEREAVAVASSAAAPVSAYTTPAAREFAAALDALAEQLVPQPAEAA